ncbi:uncharacterized protein B0I36DRAFT_430490 [Microdochium trichocladiopsis]|uniref:Protection of telomeres protein 1 n=1 Tax=Microdochium trichocladiopsis TaxID=1682393 RepID=A0A9P9BRZ0_9PEZI|nr:uncharacterized protein B0I36DRAFT_430490 [Microdochium trichocladiopsis]KAH7033223.1 hypothetical protein B0I36DRAFT_430490 [Microdochium trichocladiopsis]
MALYGDGNGEAPELPLPKHLTKISDVLSEEVRVNSFVNVLGVIRDYRPPMRSRGKDFKSALAFFDKSTEPEGGSTLTINIFQRTDEMPEISSGDVVLILGAKVQNWGGPSLITSFQTAIYIYSASRIPKPPAIAALAFSGPIGGKTGVKKPTDTDHAYVSWLYHNVESYLIPAAEEFRVQVERAMVTTDKFKLLKDAKDYTFCNAIVQVVLSPYVDGDRATLWVTDYTSNDGFKRFSHEARPEVESSDGDPYGYIKTGQKDWPGPYGQRAMQVTAWGVHAETIGANVAQGSWLMLRNMQIKFGHDALHLEGFLREERGSRDPKLLVEVLSLHDDIDERLKDALKRKLSYEKSKQKLLQEQGQGTSSQVRKSQKKPSSDQPERENRKTKRQKLHAKLQQQEAEKQAADKTKLDQTSQAGAKPEQVVRGPRLNRSIKCQSIERPATRLSAILPLQMRKVGIEGEETSITLPFVNSKHRVIVRVVDFAPRKLQDFARWRQKTEFDILSEHSGAESDSDDDMNRSTLEAYRGKKLWEWRFALQLEEVNLDEEEKEPLRIWVVVDNIEGQQLTNLNACDLRAEEDQLNLLKEQMFRLWGNLEEIRSAQAQSNAARRKRIDAGKPPDSSPPKAPTTGRDAMDHSLKLSNTPFSCCIRQYGVKVPEGDQDKADAGSNQRWQRLFGIFGTRIVSGIAE